MDFVIHLQRSVTCHDVVWVIVDKLIKSAHLFLVSLRIFTTKLTQLYIKEIIRLHGVPSNIVLDRGLPLGFGRLCKIHWEPY